jgi:very-short-patch-repair endonuclease
MTTAEYKAKFGDEIVSVRLAHRLGKASREMTDERKQQVSKTLMPYCKMPKSESHRKNLSIAKTGTSWGSHTEEHKKNVGPKIAAALAEKRAKGWVRRHNLSDGGREKLRQKMKAWNDAWRDAGYPKRNTNKGMKLTLTEKQREARSRRQIERLVRGEIAGKTGTAPEIKMMQFLTSANIDYVHQFALGTEKGSWAYDFYIPERNLLVATDGEYFHAKSKCVINRDKIKERVARERGFDFIRISDKDWRPELVFASTEEQVAHCEDLLGRRLKMITERPDVSNS